MDSKYVETAFKTKGAKINPQWSVETGVDGHWITPVENIVIKDTSRCRLRFEIPEDMTPPVLFYYQLTNFFQNHRRYVDSFDTDQLKGKVRSYSQIKGGDCDPLWGDEKAEKPYYPCGLIANSLFNDTFTNPELLNGPGGDRETYKMANNTDIAWNSDKDLYGKTDYKFDEVLPPPNWQARYPDRKYTNSTPPPNIKEWEGFQVWMRTAGLPSFSKLYQRNDNDALKKGRYELTIDDRTFFFSFSCPIEVSELTFLN